MLLLLSSFLLRWSRPSHANLLARTLSPGQPKACRENGRRVRVASPAKPYPIIHNASIHSPHFLLEPQFLHASSEPISRLRARRPPLPERRSSAIPPVSALQYPNFARRPLSSLCAPRIWSKRAVPPCLLISPAVHPIYPWRSSYSNSHLRRRPFPSTHLSRTPARLVNRGSSPAPALAPTLASLSSK